MQWVRNMYAMIMQNLEIIMLSEEN
jgi:hypothetical protein